MLGVRCSAFDVERAVRKMWEAALRRELLRSTLKGVNRHRLLLVLLMFVALLSGFSSAQAQPPPNSDTGTGVEGVISIGPVHGGPLRPGVPNSRPFANIEFVVENENGTVTSFKTDDQGRFRISLAAGHYTVSMKERKGGIGHYGPFEVDVAAGKVTKVEWQCDTGMR
jgi:hypothetical protein